MPNQKQVWNKIAPEWFEFKKVPSRGTLLFLDKQKGNILDLGSGSGRYLREVKNGKMYLVDFSSAMIRLARKKAKAKQIDAEFTVANMTKLPFKKNFFDGAIANASLHCVEGEANRKKAVKELYRVLKPGAKAEISVWNKDTRRFKNSPKERFVAWRDKGKRYYYLFSKKEAYDLFREAGFKISKKEKPSRMIVFVVRKPS